jgi:hypothetical protein
MLCEQCGSLLLCRRHVVEMQRCACYYMSSHERVVREDALGTCDAFSQFTAHVL